MNISLNGYGTGYATLEAAKGLTEGSLAKISANRTAAAAGDGEAIVGRCCRCGTAWRSASFPASARWPTPAVPRRLAIPPWLPMPPAV